MHLCILLIYGNSFFCYRNDIDNEFGIKAVTFDCDYTTTLKGIFEYFIVYQERRILACIYI